MNPRPSQQTSIAWIARFFVWATRNSGPAFDVCPPLTVRRAFPARVALIGGMAAVPALALAADLELNERAPTADERQAIERVLRANDFVSWGTIELDEGRYWEADDARRADGQPHEVELTLGTLRVIGIVADD